MGIRSDVGLAIKRDAYVSLDLVQFGKIKDIIDEADSCEENDSGFLFVWWDIKWYHKTYNEIMSLYEVLEQLQLDDFIVIEACPEDPSNTSADRGSWHANPWNLRKYTTCSLEIG